VTFRDQLLATLQELRPVLEEPGVLVVGSEVPNLLQADAAATLVVSRDVDLAVPVEHVDSFKRRLRRVTRLVPSAEEPSVYVPTSPDLIEANFLGLDTRLSDASETYVREDPDLPLMVFGPLGLLRPGPLVVIDGLEIPLPRPGDLVVEKLLTDRSGEKGARDLLVVAGLLATAPGSVVGDIVTVARALPPDSCYAIQSSLATLSLMEPHPGMPDPTPMRAMVKHLLDALERR
jgi:hypothetical protein